MARSIILLLDSFGIGYAHDAEKFGDSGADTLGHICEWMAANRKSADGSSRYLHLPNLARLGLAGAAELSRGQKLAYPLSSDDSKIDAAYTYAEEISHGKDTLSGHWEITGVPVLFDWGYFPQQLKCFPKELVEKIIKQGNLLVVGRSYEDYQVRAIDLQANTNREMLKFGEGSGESIGITGLTVGTSGTVTALDYRTGKLHELSAAPLSRGETTSAEIQLNPETFHLAAVKGESFVISTGLYEEGRYRYYSEESGEERYYLSYPGHPEYPNLSERAKSMLYASTVLRLRPDNKAFVCTDMRSGIMDICRVENGCIEGVCRRCFYYPKVRIIDTKNKVDVAYYKDNIAGFQDVAVSDDRIYVLYSGKTYRDVKQNISQCQTLLIFDWEGTLLSSVALDTPVYTIFFDMVENELYGLKGTYGDIALVRLDL